MDNEDLWPDLPLAPWRDTYATLHRYTQVIGKIALALAPMTNHWWQAALRVTARGLATHALPYRGDALELELDFHDHELRATTSRGERRVLALSPRPVAEFYRDVMATLAGLGMAVRIHDVPVEIPGDTTPFGDDRRHAAYDADAVARWARAQLSAAQVLERFRARFTGKASPVHFWWGSFDLAASRFSGRLAPARPGADLVNREAYAEEVASVGFWPGSEATGGAAFYAYVWPEPAGFRDAAVQPTAACYDAALGELILPYDVVRTADDPAEVLLAFCQSAYEAGAVLGGWDRARLERRLPEPTSGAPAQVSPEQPVPAP